MHLIRQVDKARVIVTEFMFNRHIFISRKRKMEILWRDIKVIMERIAIPDDLKLAQFIFDRFPDRMMFESVDNSSKPSKRIMYVL